MKYKIVFTPGAKEDLRNAAIWYNKQRKGLGKDFVKRIRERAAEIQDLPLSCQIRYKDIHTAVIEQFPYMMHYWVNEDNKTIYIITILHTSQDPNKWNDDLE